MLHHTKFYHLKNYETQIWIIKQYKVYIFISYTIIYFILFNILCIDFDTKIISVYS